MNISPLKRARVCGVGAANQLKAIWKRSTWLPLCKCLPAAHRPSVFIFPPPLSNPPFLLGSGSMTARAVRSKAMALQQGGRARHVRRVLRGLFGACCTSVRFSLLDFFFFLSCVRFSERFNLRTYSPPIYIVRTVLHNVKPREIAAVASCDKSAHFFHRRSPE